jgi:hypothetical protein
MRGNSVLFLGFTLLLGTLGLSAKPGAPTLKKVLRQHDWRGRPSSDESNQEKFPPKPSQTVAPMLHHSTSSMFRTNEAKRKPLWMSARTIS